MGKAFSRPGWNGLGDRFFQSLYLIGRLKPGVTPTQASAETNLLFKQILRSYLGSQPPQKHLDDIAHASIQLNPGGRGVSYLRYAFSLPLEILMAITAGDKIDVGRLICCPANRSFGRKLAAVYRG